MPMRSNNTSSGPLSLPPRLLQDTGSITDGAHEIKQHIIGSPPEAPPAVVRDPDEGVVIARETLHGLLDLYIDRGVGRHYIGLRFIRSILGIQLAG